MKARGVGFASSHYSDVPLFNIQAVTAATGVPAITLRSWERRYGIPQPKRDTKGYRLYSERDIAVTRWLKERVQEGVGISRAVHMLSMLDQVQAADEPATLDPSVLRERLLGAIRALDSAGIDHVVAEALIVAPVEEVCLDVIQTALYEVGDLWEQGALTVTAEHHASSLLRERISQLVRISPSPLRSDRVVVGCAPGELHDMGALMLVLFLRRRGFDVIFAGASVEADDFVDDVARLAPAAVLLSATTPASAKALAAVFERLSEKSTAVLAFGGRAFNQDPELRESTPGEWLGEDALASVLRAEDLLGSFQMPGRGP